MKIFNQSNSFKTNTAIEVDSGVAITYEELDSDITSLSGVLPNNNKNLLFIICKNNLETVVGYLAALRTESVAFLLPADLSQDALCRLINSYEPNFIWSDAVCNSNESIYSFGNYTLKINSTKAHILDKDLRILLPTSGTLGSSKFVKLSKTNLESNASSIIEYLNLNHNERALLSMPLNYSYGLSVLNTHLAVGASVLLTDLPIISKEFFDFISNKKPTSLSGVPYFYSVIRRLKLLEKGLPSLRYLTQAGGKISEEDLNYFINLTSKNNLDFIVMYGQTEATARIAYLPSKYLNDKSGSVGIPIPEGQILILNEDNNPVDKPYFIGEIQYIGPNVMMGYAETLSDLSLPRGSLSLNTGDLGYFDDDGFLFITGRKKRIVKIQGTRISLDEIESTLKEHSLDILCHSENDQLLIGITKNSTTVDKARIKIKEVLKIHKSNYQLILIKEIIYNNNGKIDYKKTFS